MLLLLSRTKECEPTGPGDFNHGCGKLDNPDLAGSHVYLLTHDKNHFEPSHEPHVARRCVQHDAMTIPIPWFYATLEQHNHQV